MLGVLFFLPFLPILLPFVSWIMVTWFETGDPFSDTKAMPIGLSIFYTLFNLICGFVFLILMNWFIRLASRTVKVKETDSQQLYFIDTGANSADLSLPIVMQVIVQQFQRVKNLTAIFNRITNYSTETIFQEQMTIAAEHLTTLRVNQKAINQYLTGMVEDKSSMITSKQIKSLLNISLMIDHIRNKYEQIYDLSVEKRKQRIWFGPTQRSILLHRINDAAVMLKRCIQLLQTGAFHKSEWRGLTIDLNEKNQDYLEYEQELVHELERGEMKMTSVITYYRMAQYMDSINESLKAILNEFTDETQLQRMDIL
jgi:hypothetical protein